MLGRYPDIEREDLERHRLVGFATVADERSAARRWYAENGVGLVQIPAYDAREPVNRGELVEVLTMLSPAPMSMAAVFPERRYIPARVRVFVEWIRELYESRMRES